MGRYLFVITVILLLVGCNGNNSKSELFGEWKTQICLFELHSLYHDTGHWEEVIYDFKYDDSIKKTQLIYTDSTCRGTPTRIESPDDATRAGNFSDLGAAQLEDGTDGGRLQLRFYSSPNESDIYNGFYSISESKICFSYLFNFGVVGISASIDGNTAIDYENCLVKMD